MPPESAASALEGYQSLRVLQDAQKIGRALARLQERLQDSVTLTVDGVYVRSCGADNWRSVSWVESAGFWFAAREVPERCYGIRFGLTYPESGGTLSPACGVDFPLVGIDRSLSAALGTDCEGQWYWLHRGRTGGRRAGVSPAWFWEYHRERTQLVADGSRMTPMVVIGAVDASDLVTQIAEFIRALEAFKRALKNPHQNYGLTASEKP